MPIRFPQEAGLRDARRVTIRPFAAGDVEAVHDFFRRLPEDYVRCAWDRIDRRATIERWAEDLDFDKAVPLLALDGTRVVADATLHYRAGGPLRLVGRIKWLIDTEFRGVGLGTVFVNDFITLARENGLRHLTCMLIRDLEEDAIATLKSMGFDSYTLPGYGTDPDGTPRDMVKMIFKL
jgi:GNAT superfamily N-acetyltransferase